MPTIRKITALGSGTLGAQIAFQTAYSGFDVAAYDINDDAISHTRQHFISLTSTYQAEIKGGNNSLTCPYQHLH